MRDDREFNRRKQKLNELLSGLFKLIKNMSAVNENDTYDSKSTAIYM